MLPNHGVDVLAAPLAGIGSLRLQTIPLGVTLTLWAVMALTEAHVEKVLKTNMISGEFLEKLPYICSFRGIIDWRIDIVFQGDTPSNAQFSNP